MNYHLYTDGACQPNPGQGGWAFIVYPEDHPEKRTVRSGHENNTTNNRMEMKAVLYGVQYILLASNPEARHNIQLFSDSKYLVDGISSWMHGWAKNNWRKKQGNKPVLNDDLWKQIYNIGFKVDIVCNHVKGHAGHPENEECDQLAVKAIQKSPNE